MLIIGIVLGFAGLGYLCWLLFALAVHALPFFAGVTAGLAAFHSGSDPIGAIVVGLIAAFSHSSWADRLRSCPIAGNARNAAPTEARVTDYDRAHAIFICDCSTQPRKARRGRRFPELCSALTLFTSTPAPTRLRYPPRPCAMDDQARV